MARPYRGSEIHGDGTIEIHGDRTIEIHGDRTIEIHGNGTMRFTGQEQEKARFLWGHLGLGGPRIW